MFAPTKPWWRHNMDTRNGLTELSIAELPHPEQTIEQTAELQVISDVKSHDAVLYKDYWLCPRPVKTGLVL